MITIIRHTSLLDSCMHYFGIPLRSLSFHPLFCLCFLLEKFKKLRFSSPILHYIHSLSRLSFSGESRVPSTKMTEIFCLLLSSCFAYSHSESGHTKSSHITVKPLHSKSSSHITHTHMYKAVKMTMCISRV